jgi:type IV pilus assembly protein PilP
MRTGNAFIIGTIATTLLILPACGGQQPAVPKKPEASKPQPIATAPQATGPQAEIKVEKEIYAYEPKGRRDPFTSLIEVKPSGVRKPLKGSSPVESFDVEEIKLIAIAWDRQHSYAMVTLPDNKSFTIRKGMTLGLYGGKVSEITRDSVIITEQVKDYKGQLKTKDTILKLRKEEE